MGLPEASIMGAGAAPSEQQAPVLPCPGFEGFEKRLEVQFVSADPGCEGSALASKRGLRNIPRVELDLMLDAAACTIVSHLSNKDFDSYVLSESSLFVYSTGVVIKTCGTTRLLQAIPQLLSSAAKLHFLPSRCRYTRGSFIFPEAQPAPYHDFSCEVAELDRSFGHLGQGGRAYMMGDKLTGSSWHIYMADGVPAGITAGPVAKEGESPRVTLEVCMTELDKNKARQFFANSGLGSAKAVTAATGIAALLPNSEIDDFSFNPCGYSMNSVEDGERHSTIHVTPEDGFSYASFECAGYSHEAAHLGKLLLKVLEVFRPGSVSVAIHADGPAAVLGASPCLCGDNDSWWGGQGVPEGYWCSSSSKQQLPGNSCTVYHTFQAQAGGSAPPSVVPLALGSVSCAASPVLKGSASQEVSPLSLPSLLALKKRASMADIAEDCSGLSSAWDSGDEFEGEEVTDHVLRGLSKRGKAVADLVSALRPVLLAKGEEELDGLCSELAGARAEALLEGTLSDTEAEKAFYVMDLGEVLRLFDLWTAVMPRVRPFYAVKCNPDKTLLRMLASLGAGFDVASVAELEAISDVFGGAAPMERLIFANPCKLPSHIRGAAAEGLHLSTFDSESELQKLARCDPYARAVLRLRIDDPTARCPLGVKYGAEMGEARRLLFAARRFGVNVVGVAFHVGSGAGDTAAFSLGIQAARRVFDMAVEIGFSELSLLDIGGGFTADGGHAGAANFRSAGAAVALALEAHFPPSLFPSLQVIAEPGRFFAETPFTLCAHVFGARARGRGGKRQYEYWINDGIYGSMNSLLYDHAVLTARPLRIASAAEALVPTLGYPGRGKHNRLFNSTVFGPTCDGLDTVLRDVKLPKLQEGDWLVFPRMGAYTKAAGSSFNGFSVDDISTAAYVLTSADARPFYSSPSSFKPGILSSFKAGSKGPTSRLGDVAVGAEEWGILEGSSDGSDDEEGSCRWLRGQGSSSGSDSD